VLITEWTAKICREFQKQTMLSYRHLSMFDRAVMFVGTVAFIHALLMSSPYFEMQPHLVPLLTTTNHKLLFH